MKRKRLDTDGEVEKKEQDEKSAKEAKPTEPTELNLADFPSELLEKIFDELSIKDFAHLALVCRLFRAVSTSTHLWRTRFLTFYPAPPLQESETYDYRSALQETLKKDLEKKASLTDHSNESQARQPSPAEEKLDALFSCLTHPGPHLENLAWTFPTLSSLISVFADSSSLQTPWFFKNVPKRLLVNPVFQEGLNHLYRLAGHSPPLMIVEKKEDSKVLVSTGPKILLCEKEIERIIFLFKTPAFCKILFNQPYDVLFHERDHIRFLHMQAQTQAKKSVFKDDQASRLSPLCFAVSLGNLEQVKHLATLGVSLNVSLPMQIERYGSPSSPFDNLLYNLVNLAAYYRHHAIVRYLLLTLEKLDITETCRHAFLAFDLDGLECLLECGVDIDFMTLREEDKALWESFLLLAVRNNRIFLIKRIWPVLATSEVKESDIELINKIMEQAAICRHFELFNFLLTQTNYTAHIKKTWKNMGRSVKWMRLETYLRSGVRVNLKKLTRHQTSAERETTVSNAVKNNCPSLVVGLFAISKKGLNRTPPVKAPKNEIHRLFWLHAAAKRGHIDMVKLLLLHGACVDKENNEGDTPLRLAVDNGHLPVVTALIGNGADPQQYFASSDQQARPALIYALLKEQVAIANSLFETLKARNQLPQFSESELNELLNNAIDKQQIPLIELLANKIFPTRASINWNGIFEQAILHGRLNIIKLIIEKKYADVQTVFLCSDQTECSALTLAIMQGRPEIVGYLVSQGAPIQKAEQAAAQRFDDSHKSEEAHAILHILKYSTQKESVDNHATLFYHSPKSPQTVTLTPQDDLEFVDSFLNI